MNIPEKIRKISPISLTDLEKKLGLGNGTIGKWKKSKPTLGLLIKVAEELNVSVEYLLAGEDAELKTELDTYTSDLVTVYQKLNPPNKVKVLNYAYELADEETSLTAKSVAKTGQEKKTKDITDLEMLKRELKKL